MQRALSPSTTLKVHRIVSQCVDVNAGWPLETLSYVCQAARCRAFVDGDTGTCRIGRERLRADTKMSLTAFENHHAALLATGLVSVKRTGRTSIYTGRIVMAQASRGHLRTTPRRISNRGKRPGSAVEPGIETVKPGGNRRTRTVARGDNQVALPG